MATESSSTSSSNAASSSQFSYPGTNYFPLPFHLQNAGPAAQQPYVPSPQIPPPVKIPTVAPAFSVPPPVVTGMYSLPQYQQVRLILVAFSFSGKNSLPFRGVSLWVWFFFFVIVILCFFLKPTWGGDQPPICYWYDVEAKAEAVNSMTTDSLEFLSCCLS